MRVTGTTHGDGAHDPEGSLDMIIRPAELGDAPAMGTVWHRAALVGCDGSIRPGAQPMPSAEDVAEQWRCSIEDGSSGALVLVACAAQPDEPVVGTIAIVPDPHDASRGQLTGLYVDPGDGGRGVGGALHDAALEHLRRAGYRMALLWVLEGNLRARAMFERRDWQLTGGRRTQSVGFDELCYLRSL
jgi:ribosomal protein S18 acetylase RimI-like enzyme